MNRIVVTAVGVAIALSFESAHAQTFNARRTAMGGVTLPGGGSGAEASNVAYRGVPDGSSTRAELPLPLGVIQLLANPPLLDPNDPNFNIYDLANRLYNPPWNYQLSTPAAPSNDVVVELGRNHLGIDLGDISSLFPEDHSRLFDVVHAPALGFGFRSFFVSASAIAQYRNDLSLNQPLHQVLAQGAAFEPTTAYTLEDDLLGQAAAALQLGWAGPWGRVGDPRNPGGSAVYGGVRAKLLRGLAYADAHNTVSFSTSDSLLATSPISLAYGGTMRDAGPAGGGFGFGVDLGAVWMNNGYEVGVGVNDLATRIQWNGRESLIGRDSLTGDFARTVLADNEPFTSSIPPTVTVNAGKRFGALLVAADVVHRDGIVTAHAGLERRVRFVALRSGAQVDPNHELQVSGGLGFKVGRLGLDLGIATNSRNLSRERAVELGAGLALYR